MNLEDKNLAYHIQGTAPILNTDTIVEVFTIDNL